MHAEDQIARRINALPIAPPGSPLAEAIRRTNVRKAYRQAQIAKYGLDVVEALEWLETRLMDD